MKEGDSIGAVHRHETSSTDELGRCHPERVDVLQGSPFMQQRDALRMLPNAEPKEGLYRMKWRGENNLRRSMKGDYHNEEEYFHAHSCNCAHRYVCYGGCYFCTSIV